MAQQTRLIDSPVSTRTMALIEDSPEDAMAFSRVFGAYGPIMQWTTGEQALSHLELGEVSPSDLAMLIVDLSLPGMDGTDVVRQLRSMPGGSHAAIFVLSASTNPDDAHRALAAGADEFIVKPTSLADLRGLAARLHDLTD